MTKRPNILFIMADQFRGDVMSWAGGPAQTPHLDALASEAVCFTNCNTVSPLCVPARISMMTGQYPHTTGAWDNAEYVLSPDAPLWSKEIKALGYATSVFGKTHLHTDFGDMIAREPIVQGYGFDYVNEISGPHATCQSRTHMSDEWKEKGVWDAYVKDMRSRGKKPRALPTPLPLEDYYDVYVGRKAKEYLEQYDGEEPWFCHVSFGGPHEPWDTPEPYASMYQREAMPEPLPRVIDMTEERPHGEFDTRSRLDKIQCSPETALEIRADYCGGVTLIDKMIGQIFEVIRKRGEWDNTVVVFTSDHGEMNGDKGIVNKRNFFRSAMNVPFIVRTPKTAKQCGGTVNESFVNLIDVGPTLVELAGGQISYQQCGRSVCHALDEDTVHRDYLLGEYAGEIMYEDKEWKIVLNRQGEPYQIFHLTEDPQERYNIAGTLEGDQAWDQLCKKIMIALAENRRLKPSLLQMPIPDRNEAEFERSVKLE
ncbi:MAG: sulfatase-like hydrolase/transferase [Lachnospiraceae bacterium]|nr:sulfatase-like hydrolase/transferase [Lachnospiraceae bacterium]